MSKIQRAFASSSTELDPRQAPAKPTAQAHAGDKPARYLTRIEAADLLGTSPASIIQLERHGKLPVHWTVLENALGNMRNAPVYKIEDLLKLPRKDRARNAVHDPDELCARAFELFEKGKTIKQVVIELRASLLKIQELRSQWLEISEPLLEVDEESRQRLVQLLGPFEGAGELVTLVETRIRRPSTTLGEDQMQRALDADRRAP
jgi:hypothetical protein